ncbi:tRNA pseudouridine(38-40) synthase TruA [Cryobacterium tepidiphilum]|uniref:tRNA pseudouridine synthase A n=1 Tax=Cryobacterium tepidiphilum TaxID=2486026 RepID=A0A3M8LEI9_9MICO|nr:tRNA pseudouridine(38-40) synthase TruA [Cryobacterium tepidiphilum]RNE63947.1 tRNA pseudouridine(38-40) synthase TruA [Cryobacterium tepidiphilum]
MSAEASPSEATTRIRLDIAYDGTGFNGWARQPGQRTVQGAIEEALATILRRHPPAPSLVVAGRTDAGVHASGQVAHLDLTDEQIEAFVHRKRGKGKPKARPEAGAAIAQRLRGILGSQPDVMVRDASVAPDGFDARFSAMWRRYRYRLADQRAERDPLQRRHTTWHETALDEAAMDEAAATLVGLHDFAAYCKSRPGATTIRTLQDFRWERDADGVLIASLRADAFCHSMVRALVGATVAVGEGKLAPERLVDLRVDKARTSEFKVMAARGLTLTQVGYPEDAELALRAVQTRARRELPTE